MRLLHFVRNETYFRIVPHHRLIAIMSFSLQGYHVIVIKIIGETPDIYYRLIPEYLGIKSEGVIIKAI